jgi:hypothetical protein
LLDSANIFFVIQKKGEKIRKKFYQLPDRIAAAAQEFRPTSKLLPHTVFTA